MAGESFTKNVTVEEAISAFVRTIPRCVELVNEESGGRSAVPEETIANISAGMILFFLSGLLPYTEEGNTEKMARAFQAMWLFVPQVGGNPEGAREWFMSFYGEITDPFAKPDRIALITKTFRRRLFPSATDDCPFDILPYTISAGMDFVKKVKLT